METGADWVSWVIYMSLEYFDTSHMERWWGNVARLQKSFNFNISEHFSGENIETKKSSSRDNAFTIPNLHQTPLLHI